MEEMKKGDLAFFYHSNCKPPGIVGIMEIVREHSLDRKSLFCFSSHLNHYTFDSSRSPSVVFQHITAKIPSSRLLGGIKKTIETANDPAHPYYDGRNQKTKNWVVVHVEFRAKFKDMVGLKQLQDHAAGGKPLADMQVLRQKRLSVSRVSAEEWRFVLGLADAAADAAE